MTVDTRTVGGITSGRNPTVYSASSPYTLFLLQALIVYFFSSLLHVPLKKIRQPRVIAEVIAGIILGPSVMGKIPKFTKTIFPKESVPGLTLVANVGIILFLFIIGLDVNIAFMKRNLKVTLCVGLAGMALPFGLGCAIAVGLYHQYREFDTKLPYIPFSTFMVFSATAICITALPVLARILRELDITNDRAGIVVLAAGIFNDLLGWILLALSVTLANADSSVNVVYILLLAAGWFLFMAFPVKYLLSNYIKRFTNDLNDGPSQSTLTLIYGIVFASAFFTDIIGVHPIFGAFMSGLVIPRENDFSKKIAKKIDGIISTVFIPLYFALAGQSVDLSSLNKGIDWGYIIGIVGLAMFGKIVGGLFASKANGLYWRESLAVGILMSCKGIVEIVVITVGLNASILNQKTYSMFIVMAVVTTFLTTPLTMWVYSDSYRNSISAQIPGKKAESINTERDESVEQNVETLTPPESPVRPTGQIA